MLSRRLPKNQIKVVFANTGEEDERTLEFIQRCGIEWDLDIVWVEADINPQKGKGTGHRVVTFETATRDHSLFEQMIDKYGIPNKNYPHCTRELKLHPIHDYVKSSCWDAGYLTAIGIRADEIDRINPNYQQLGLTYPLCDIGVRKGQVFAFWDKQPFDLTVPEHRGNCVWCWKKSLRKQLTLAKETPQVFKFAMRMEEQHADSGRVFFRDRRTSKDIIELAREPFETFLDERYLDQNEGCEDGCEINDPSQMSMVKLWKDAAE